MQEKYRKIENELSLYEEYETGDADIVVVAYGISARIAKSSIDYARESGKKIGMFRPITLWPFPSKELERVSKGKKLAVIEMAHNQLEQDVRLATSRSDVLSLNKLGGMVFREDEIREFLLKI